MMLADSPIILRTSLIILLTAVVSPAVANEPAQFKVERMVVRRGYDGQRCWVHARAGAIPSPGNKPDRPPRVVMTMQPLQITGSDVFYALNELSSVDLGHHWTEPVARDSFARKKIDARIEMTVCDFTPQWHTATGKLLGTGQTVWYRDNKVMKVRPRATAYAV